MVFKRLSTGGMESKQQHTTSEEKEIMYRTEEKNKAKPSHFFFGRTTARRRESLDPIAAVRCVVDCGESLLAPFKQSSPLNAFKRLSTPLTHNQYRLDWLEQHKYWFIQIEISNWKSSLNRRLTKIIRSIIILIACGFPFFDFFSSPSWACSVLGLLFASPISRARARVLVDEKNSRFDVANSVLVSNQTLQRGSIEAPICQLFILCFSSESMTMSRLM